MSVSCFFQQVSPRIIEKLQFHPSIVDLFQEAATLQEYPDDYWQGIEGLQEEWESEDEDLGEQLRVTREVYEQIKLDLPDIIQAGLFDMCWIGGDGSFDWLEIEGIISIEIGNYSYYGYINFFRSEQVVNITEKLEKFREFNYLEAHKILYPKSDLPENNKQEEEYFWENFDKTLSYCHQAVINDNGLITRILG